MAKKNIKVDYDNEEDLLHLAVAEQKVKFSFDVELPNGDIVIDFGFNGQIVGLEFFEASNNFPFLKKLTKNNIKADLNIQYGRNWAQISYVVAIPGKAPIQNSIISPYNRKLVDMH